eukprot:g3221.t1
MWDGVGRSTYFGMYEPPTDRTDVSEGTVQKFDDDLADGFKEFDTSASVRVRANRFLSRIQKKLRVKRHVSLDNRNMDNRRYAHNLYYKKDGTLVHRDGVKWAFRDKIRQYRKDTKKEEDLLEKLSLDDDDLVNKSFDYSSQLEEVLGNVARLHGEIMQQQKNVKFETANAQKLKKGLKAAEKRLFTQRGLHLLERERFNKLVDQHNRVESKYKEKNEELQRENDEEYFSLQSQHDELLNRLEKNRAILFEAQMLRRDTNERKIENERMKASLKMGETQSLHSGINAVMTSSHVAMQKLTGLVAHLQKEIKVTSSLTEELEAENNVLKEELEKTNRKNVALKRSLRARNFDEDVPASIVKFARKIGEETGNGYAKEDSFRLIQLQLKSELNEIEFDIKKAKEESNREKEKSREKQDEILASVGKERKALLHYAQDLEEQIERLEKQKEML